MCMEHLSTEAYTNFSRCLSRSWPEETETKYINYGCCHFLSREGDRERVLLASFPGSGNTWVRGLLEGATGVCTGKI